MKRLLSCLLVCAMPALSMAAPFESSLAPDAGKMRVYVFRPAFNDQAFVKEAPTLRVDGKVVGQFKQGSYTEFQLDAGKHEFSIEPAGGESTLWRTSFPVKAVEGQVLHLGFWVAQKLNKRLSRTAAFFAGPLLSYALDGENEPTELRLDPMDPADAEPMLRECEALPRQ